MLSNQQPWYAIDGVENLDSPALVVYPQRVRENISRAIDLCGSTSRLRPHVKTSKSADVVNLMLNAGITRFKCSTITEAEMLGNCGAPDVLLAYQPVGPRMQRFFTLAATFPNTRFSCLVDDTAVVEQLSAMATRKERQVEVYIDLNVGMNRTGILPGTAAMELYHRCILLDGIIPVGLHAYDGHIHDASLEVRRQRCTEAFAPVEALRAAIVDAGFPPPIIVAGGTPSFPIHAANPEVICSPGTFVYWDKGYLDKFTEQPFLPAALLLARVLSKPRPGTICLDLGHKAVAAENEIGRRVGIPDYPGLVALGQSEEHLVLETGSQDTFRVGDLLYVMPWHICPTVALHQFAYIVEDHRVTGRWMTTARDRFITI